MCGSFIEISQRPSWNSVQDYKDYLKKNSPGPEVKQELISPDIECTACGQKAPSEAAAFIKVPDHTPVSLELSGQKGQQLWICADCFNHGVRPKYVKYGEIHWNKEGRRIKKRAEERSGHPW